MNLCCLFQYAVFLHVTLLFNVKDEDEMDFFINSINDDKVAFFWPKLKKCL